VAALAVTGLASCGGASPSGTATHRGSAPAPAPGSAPAPASSSASAAASSSSAGTTSPRRRRRVSGPPVGATQSVHAGGSTLAVTVTHLLDPLPAGDTAVLPGTRAVGVQVTVADESGATYDSTASGDWSVIPSTGAASPLFVRTGVCQTPLVDFESLIGPGETRSGCVAFSVPRGARVLGIRFSPHTRAPGAVTWR
jgi:hypothetical protein